MTKYIRIDTDFIELSPALSLQEIFELESRSLGYSSYYYWHHGDPSWISYEGFIEFHNDIEDINNKIRLLVKSNKKQNQQENNQKIKLEMIADLTKQKEINEEIEKLEHIIDSLTKSNMKLDKKSKGINKNSDNIQNLKKKIMEIT